MAIATLEYTYTTQTYVEQMLSAIGVTLRLDDGGDGSVSAAEQLAMTDAIVEATETCNYYLAQKYTYADLATSNWVNRCATVLAVYVLAARRLDPIPDSIAERAEKYEEKLKEIRDKGGQVPGLPMKITMAPTGTNTRCDIRFNWRVIRVERGTSTKKSSTLPQRPDYNEGASQEW